MRGRRPGQRHDHRTALSAQTVLVQGRELTFPIEVRAARSWAAQFLVPASPAQRLLDHAGLRVARLSPGRTMLVLTFVRYEDSDLDAYNELGVIFLVRGPRGRGVYVHHLPVDQEFTLAAGREIWGYPKFLADISIEERGHAATCALRHDDADVLQLTVRAGSLPFPQPALQTYTFLDGVLRVTRWRTTGSARGRLGGASLELGTHPIADELRKLGLPHRAVAVSSMASFGARFGAAEVLNQERA